MGSGPPGRAALSSLNDRHGATQARVLAWVVLHAAISGTALGSTDLADVGRLRALGPVLHVVLDLLALRQAAKPLGLDGGMVDEHVLAAGVRRDETKPLCIIEPLHRAARHLALPGAKWRRSLVGDLCRPGPSAQWPSPAKSPSGHPGGVGPTSPRILPRLRARCLPQRALDRRELRGLHQVRIVSGGQRPLPIAWLSVAREGDE